MSGQKPPAELAGMMDQDMYDWTGGTLAVLQLLEERIRTKFHLQEHF